MGLTGPIKPKYYINYTSIAPNPDSATTGAVNEIIQCPKTGRLWIQQAAAFPYSYQQVLPYVRNDGTPSQVATMMTNDNGTMLVSNEAGSTDGEMNLFGSLRVNATSVKTPNLLQGEAFIDSANALQSSPPTQLQGISDVTINTTITNLTNYNFTASEDGVYEYEMHATFFHNNAYNVSLGIRFFESVSNYYYLTATTVGTPSGGGGHWSSCVVKTRANLMAGNSLRCAAAADVAGVTLKAQPLFTFPFAGQAAWTTYASYAIIRRIG